MHRFQKKVIQMPNNPNEREGFVSRWSRRKQQVEEEQNLENSQDADSSEKSNDVNLQQGIDVEKDIDPEILKAEKFEALNQLSDEDMPDIETLNEDSDFSGFMSTGVSEGLRTMALKKLFMGKSFNIRDGLDEYDDDYTKFEKMPSTMVTADMKHMVEVEAKKQLAKEQEEERQRMIASGEIDEFEEIDEFDEFADDEEETIIAEAEEYVDEHINVDGFDTTEVDDGFVDESKNESTEETKKTNDNEEVA